MIIVTRFVRFNAMALYPFILIKKDEMRHDKVLIHHEKIHHRQQLELLIIPFYILYGLNYLVNLIKYKNAYLAYLEICFEREAYINERNFDYLKERKLFNFVRYLNRNTK